MTSQRGREQPHRAPHRESAKTRSVTAAPATEPSSSAGNDVPENAYFTVKGRRWRATDPNLPEPFKAALTRELMSARRAVKQHKGVDALAERAARDRVQDAKVALGERGPKWWLPMTEQERNTRVAATIRALARERGDGKSLCPSEVARALGGDDWRSLMPCVRAVAFELQSAGDVRVTQKSRVVNETARGAIRVQIIA